MFIASKENFVQKQQLLIKTSRFVSFDTISLPESFLGQLDLVSFSLNFTLHVKVREIILYITLWLIMGL